MTLLSSNQLEIPTADYVSKNIVYSSPLFSYLRIHAFTTSKFSHTFTIFYLAEDTRFCLPWIVSFFQYLKFPLENDTSPNLHVFQVGLTSPLSHSFLGIWPSLGNWNTTPSLPYPPSLPRSKWLIQNKHMTQAKDFWYNCREISPLGLLNWWKIT